MKTNYQAELDKEIAALRGERVPLLLHSCCGPCSSYVLEYLTQFFDVTVFWYNPNIFPREEYDLRLENQRKVIAAQGLSESVKIIEGPWEHEEFLCRAEGFETAPEGGERCARCFKMRLEALATKAAELGFSRCCTTLTVSPHKNAQLLNEIGAAEAAGLGIHFLPSDFKKRDGYKRSIELSRQFDIYRQDYCGCEFCSRAGK